jgi:hypothetical protein
MQYSLLDITDEPFDYSGKRVLIPTSEGINSAAVLCVLGEYHPEERKPEKLYLFDVHMVEHSPDSLQFAYELIAYARTRFKWVAADIVQKSMNQWCLENKMIPHPSRSPCSRELKMQSLDAYALQNRIDYRLIGYVKHEVNTRWKRAQNYVDDSFQYPLLRLTDEDCFSIVKSCIGWYPKIYDIKEMRRGKARRVFNHNNCLPCKNATTVQLADVGKYFPAHAQAAQEVAAQIPGAYWGRDDVPEVFKCDSCTRFG